MVHLLGRCVNESMRRKSVATWRGQVEMSLLLKTRWLDVLLSFLLKAKRVFSWIVLKAVCLSLNPHNSCHWFSTQFLMQVLSLYWSNANVRCQSEPLSDPCCWLLWHPIPVASYTSGILYQWHPIPVASYTKGNLYQGQPAWVRIRRVFKSVIKLNC